ncbi:MAG TPA: proprotein convertase P-domain-containing protein, partial [Thermoanaerobaculia bacterium]|nr:proprotein convertase P-domain-containing protein [Thermoanaerobaculia bacterium]
PGLRPPSPHRVGRGEGEGKLARVFDPNPVAAINAPDLRNRNDSPLAVPESAYSFVELQDVAPSGPLRGPHVQLVDTSAPFIPPPDASQSLVFDRAQDGFEDVNVYFHIDRNQRHLQSLGYTGARAIVPYAIEVDAHAVGGADNSFFLPSSTQAAIGSLFFGEGGTDDAEDADLVVHEYGHAILEWIAPGTFSGAFASESRALSEGFGDYWAYSAHVEQRLASGRDPFCFADWDARCWDDDASERCGYDRDSDCLRRLDSTKTMADFERGESGGVEHRNGMIWSSALREIHQQLGRTITDTIVIESLFDTPPRPTYAIAARRLLEADRLLYGAAHAPVICAAMMARGILGSCDDTPRGEQTLFQSFDRSLRIPENNSAGVTSTLTIDDARAIERIFVRVDIAHPSRGDLRIELVAPDGTTVMLQQVSFERDADVRTTFGLTAAPVESLDVLRGRGAAGVWKLVVRDLRQRDAGTLLSWGLVIQFEGDAPAMQRPRADERQMIPVVANLFGVGATRFVSDVRIANTNATPEHATLIFTRSGADGTRDFSAVHVQLAPGQTIAFDDVVASALHTSGSGSLEVLGRVHVMSRTYAIDARGTLGQQVPANLHTTALVAPPLVIAPFPLAEYTRTNLGITETRGARVLVRAGDRDVELPPFSHVQFPIANQRTEVRVVEGSGSVVAYASQVSQLSGDPIFVPGQRVPFTYRTVIAPTIASGAWRSDLWLSAAQNHPLVIDTIAGGIERSFIFTIEPVTIVEDVDAVPLGVLRMDLPPDVAGGMRIRTSASQFVPLLPPQGPEVQHLLFIETTPPYRTNIAIASGGRASAEVFVYDAAGTEVMRTTLATTGGVAQMPVVANVVSGRAIVRFTEGSGQAYASLVDGRTGDATFVGSVQ